MAEFAPLETLDDEDFTEVLVDLILMAEKRGLVKTACHTHDGVPMLHSEVVTFEEDYDQCIPVMRLWMPEQVEAVAAGVDEVL